MFRRIRISSRKATTRQARGLVVFDGNSVAIPDVEHLMDFAEFRSNYLHLDERNPVPAHGNSMLAHSQDEDE